MLEIKIFEEMLNKYSTWLVVFSVLLLADSACRRTAQDPFEVYADSVMKSVYNNDAPGAIILVAKDGKPVYRKAFGLANLELGVRNEPGYLFNIGSMTKQFTAVSILKLAQESKLTLVDDIRDYLPDYNTHGRLIKIENLLTHTSGIPSYTEKPDFVQKMTIDYTNEEIVHYFMNDSLLFEPGTDWSYSNAGYFLLGLVVEKVSGKSLHEYIRENIFNPLGMNNTFFGSGEKIIPYHVNGYSGSMDNPEPAVYTSWKWPYAAGDIISCVDDLLKWDTGLSEGKIVSNEWLEKAWTPFMLKDGRSTNYGYGWATGNYDGLRIIAHDGGFPGFLCSGVRIPAEKLYVVILSNTTSLSPDPASFLVAIKAAGKNWQMVPKSFRGEKDFETYTGTYEMHSFSGRITGNFGDKKYQRHIYVRNDTLCSQVTDETPLKLIQVDKDLFITPGTSTYYKFSTGEGQSVTLTIFDEPVQYGPREVESKISE